MLKLASMIFTILGTTLAGIAVLVVLVVPSLADQGMKMIPIAALIGALIGLPLSYWVARKIMSLQKTVSV
jgi:hypothetical protein